MLKFILIYSIIAVVCIILTVIFSMNHQRKNENGEVFEKFNAGNSFGSINNGRPITAVLKEECLYIYDSFHKECNVSLNYKKITDVSYTSSVEIIEKSKSVAGRALVGGAILGPVGAVVGGLSGTGKKQERKAHNYILVSYKDSSTGETKGILLEIGLNAYDKFAKDLRKKANLTTDTSVEL